MNYLFKIDEKIDDDVIGIYSSLMPGERRDFFVSCKDSLRRKQTVMAYLLLCYALYDFCQLDDVRLKFVYSNTGKPYLMNHSDIYFSISHSEKYVLCSVSREEIGADIQVKSDEDISAFAKNESLFKLGLAKDKAAMTAYFETQEYAVAVSQFVNPSNEIYEVSFEKLFAYIDKHTTISAYLELNRNKGTSPCRELPLQLFKRKVKEHPNRIAVVFKNERITYKQLDEYSDVIAYRLKEVGVKAGEPVLLSVSAGIDFSVSQWGILKTGAYYIPISNRWPEDRVNYIVRDSGADVILIDKKSPFFACDAKIKINCSDYKTVVPAFPTVCEEEEQGFYMIYTSGSTGTPKGVMVSKKNLSTFSQNVVGSYFYEIVGTNEVNVACICPVSFDMSVGENTTTLLNGATVVFADDEEQLPNNFSYFIISNNIKVLWATPSKFKMYLKTESCAPALDCLDKVVLAGETLDIETATLSSKYSFELFNTYAPTETTIISTYYKVDKDISKTVTDIPIGRPFAREACYIISEDGSLCELGEKGELCIGGDCVALGYKNKPDETAKRFMNNPFSSGHLYRTGDIAALDANNNIRFFGRKDYQVKVNGFRVELEEIEATIFRLTSIKAIVVFKNGVLLAVVEEGSCLHLESLKNKLPDYMLPVLCYTIKKFPLNNNGKIDRKKIESFIDNIKTDNPYTEPENDLQRRILKAWEKILSYRPIGIDDSYYAIGGDSIAAMRIAATLQTEDINISMFDILTAKTIRNLSELIERKSDSLTRIKRADLPMNEFAFPGEVLATDELWKYISNFSNSELECEYVPLDVHSDIMKSSASCNRRIFKLETDVSLEKAIDIAKRLVENNPAFRTVYDRKANKCSQYKYAACWYVPNVKINEINFDFLTEMEKVSLQDNIQYLSYVFIVWDMSGDLYIATALNWAFTDRKTENNIYNQLLLYLNEDTTPTEINPFGPCEYAQKVKELKGAFLKDAPDVILREVETFSELSSNTALNDLLISSRHNRFLCKLGLSEKFIIEFYRSPMDFIIRIFSEILRIKFKVDKIPIYVIEQNRNPMNEHLISSVIDFIPLVTYPSREDYYSVIRAFISHKLPGDMLMENQTWDNSNTMLPFVNFLPSYDEENARLVVHKTNDICIENRSEKQLSVEKPFNLSAFIKDGKLVLSLDVPNDKESLEKYIKDVFN